MADSSMTNCSFKSYLLGSIADQITETTKDEYK